MKSAVSQCNISLFGVTSIVGFNVALLEKENVTCYCTSRTKNPRAKQWGKLDLEVSEQLKEFFSANAPDVLLYCDAICDVEKCEHDEDWADRINVRNFERVLELIPSETKLVYVSSDHVFGHDGIYTEESEPCPISVYGRSRVKAERVAAERPGTLIIRAGLPIGRSLDGKTGHKDWLTYRMSKGLPVTIIKNEARSAVPADMMAERLVGLAASDLTGIRHITAESLTLRPDLANHLMDKLGLEGEVALKCRFGQPYPHIGMIELGTVFDDDLAAPLPSILTL